jgi:membrane protease YdiL (CAAX protease family)
VVLPSYFFLGIVLIINLITLIIGLQIVFPELYDNIAFIVIPYPWPNFIYPIEITGNLSIMWYAFVVISIVLSVIWLFKTEGKDFINIFSKAAKRIYPPPSKSDNSFVMIAQFFFALWFFNILIVLILLLIGTPAESPVGGEEVATWEIFFALANASVAEEIFTRIIYIGIPLLIIDYGIRGRYKRFHKYFIGGGFETDKVTISLIVISSLIFGFAHYPGWGLWKVLPTTVAGLALGYLFVKKGIHAAIILHFLTNYMGIILILFEDNIGVLVLIGLLFLLMMFAWSMSGFLYFILYLEDILSKISNKIFYGGSSGEVIPTGQIGDVNYVKANAWDRKTQESKPPVKVSEKPLREKEPIEIVWHSDEPSAHPERGPHYPQRSQHSQHSQHSPQSQIPKHSAQDWYDQNYQPQMVYHHYYYGPPYPPTSHTSRSPDVRLKEARVEHRICPWCSNNLTYNPINRYWYCNRCYSYIL